MNLETVSDDELIELYHNQARDMSFYAASEGESWYRERLARESCKAELALIAQEVYARGMDLPKGNYLC